MNMNGIFGIINVQEDLARRSPIRLDERLNQHLGDAIKVCPRDGVLYPGERRLAGQGRFVGKSLASHLQGRVLAQCLGFIGLLVAVSDLEDPWSEHVEQQMPGVTGMAAVVNDLSDTVKKSHPAFDLAQEKHSACGRRFTAVKVDFELFCLRSSKRKRSVVG